MANENKMKAKLMQMTSRQKIIIGVMAVVVLIIIWQIYGLFGGESVPPPPPVKPIAKMNAEKPTQPGQPAASTEVMPKPPGPPELKQATSIVNDPQFNQMQRITEEKFVGKLNELEELRIQRQIAETNQAIAAAKLATVTAEKDISDLLTRPAPGSAAFAPKTSLDITPGGAPPGVVTETTTPKPPTPPPVEFAPYKLISVSMLFNRWAAIMTLQDATFSVGVGDVLPPDGSTVVNINKNSITLKKDGKVRKVNITASI